MMKRMAERQHALQSNGKIVLVTLAVVCLLYLLFSGRWPISSSRLSHSSTASSSAQVDIGNAQTFSSAIKAGLLEPGTETLLFSTNEGPGYTTQQWFTIPSVGEYTDIRVYVDGEDKPSIEFNLFLGHGIGCSAYEERNHTPWSTEFISHTADHNSALYNNYRIPFAKSLRITATLPLSPRSQVFWYLIHGVYNSPLVVGGYRLPSSARLRLHRQVNKALKPLDFLTMVDVKGSGWLFQVTMSARSQTFGFLEGCHSAEIDGSPAQFFSSGTEDLFLSAFYFDRGVFHTDDSGLTCITEPPFDGYWQMSVNELEREYKKKFGKKYPGTHFSAYKFFVKDPLFFQKSLRFRWRCGESESDKQRCPRSARRGEIPHPKWPKAEPTTITTYSWVYHF